ncbi:hypothetical protein [Granulicella arctica]|uniref:Uncharacterized protein n=1 Tax=Granulicella arctica TaxID=940613 RepID=A0A7Y9TUR0_9BACT|nr:hypothetical protein [Granulicella arctica]NYF81103.1 hypothetical protein [Granulicella arctica]
MTWHTFFDLSTLESRHLLAVYALVLLTQGGYFAWTLWGWLKLKKLPRLNS